MGRHPRLEVLKEPAAAGTDFRFTGEAHRKLMGADLP